MCKYCTENGFQTIIESNYTEYASNIWGKIHVWEEPEVNDNSVVIDMRGNHGYIRLGDRREMNCIDHENKIKANYCFNCGRKLGD